MGRTRTLSEEIHARLNDPRPVSVRPPMQGGLALTFGANLTQG
jgi:hypothetical protein